ncbi:hypothetical protein ACMD2_07200 [Ananas comosus]|uniref:Uncharacterized protein n=1 Tax=Ananas comosus TaxID=4615 RepID=A0A199VN78_ANACO|nr:hypothetical protein ACMD2_07200 [Ananas comosus]
MEMDPRLLKKPKLEEPSAAEDGGGGGGGGGAGDGESEREQEEALVALIEHRTKEVQHLKQKLAYYKSQLDEAEKRLGDSQSKLGRLRSRSNGVNGGIKVEKRSPSPVQMNGTPHSRPPPLPPSSRPQLLIPALNTKTHSPAADSGSGRAAKADLVPAKAPAGVSSRAASGISSSSSPSPSQSNSGVERLKQESLSKNKVERGSFGSQEKTQKRVERKLAQKEHQDVIPSIRSRSSPSLLRFQTATVKSSQHKRKLRSLELCPANEQLFVTSALDGVVTLWQLQAKGPPTASLLSTTDCLSPKQRRWPEDLTWHPDGDSIFAAYSADGGDSQISVLNLNVSGEKKVTFLEAKPHLKGIINSINFMPWVDLCFVTGGSDHAVVLWQERGDTWNHKKVHGNLHSSAVMGISGLYQKKTILSAGADKRIIGFDLAAGRSEFKHQIESKCMSVLPNPADFNLFMVQTGAPGKQLRLFDIRLRQTEIHAFGWKQESSDSQSALINQSWSPDGLYISSGSADPVIHIFDIRYNTHSPSQSVQAHQKRVFKAEWHQSLPLMISISSDLNIGLHKVG